MQDTQEMHARTAVMVMLWSRACASAHWRASRPRLPWRASLPSCLGCLLLPLLTWPLLRCAGHRLHAHLGQN